jgi:hypothetical protein
MSDMKKSHWTGLMILIFLLAAVGFYGIFRQKNMSPAEIAAIDAKLHIHLRQIQDSLRITEPGDLVQYGNAWYAVTENRTDNRNETDGFICIGRINGDYPKNVYLWEAFNITRIVKQDSPEFLSAVKEFTKQNERLL